MKAYIRRIHIHINSTYINARVNVHIYGFKYYYQSLSIYTDN